MHATKTLRTHPDDKSASTKARGDSQSSTVKSSAPPAHMHNGPPAISLRPNVAQPQPGASQSFGQPLGPLLIPIPLTAPCAPTIVTGSTPTLIYTQGKAGAGRDSIAADYPYGLVLGLPNFKMKLVSAAIRESDRTLLSVFAAELGMLGGEAGIRAVTYFMSGAGGAMVYKPGTAFSTLTSKSIPYLIAVLTALKQIDAIIRAQARTCHIDYTKIKLPSGSIPDINFKIHRDAPALASVIGGTHALWVSITNFTADPGKRTYKAVLSFDIYDTFGVDESDLYSPGLISFYVLQHFRNGPRPFIHRIIVEHTINGSY